MRTIPFERGHLPQIDLGEYERELFNGFDIATVAKTWPSGPAITIIDGDRILGSAGIYVSENRGIVWVVLSDEVRRHPAFLLRTGLRLVNQPPDGIDVLLLSIPVDNPEWKHWAEALGFTFNRIAPNDGVDPRPHLEYRRWPPEQS